MPPTSLDDLLQNLNSSNASEAWERFLSEYSAHIYQVIRHFEQDADNAGDCFQFVCEQLIENQSRRLRKFKGDGSATFVTWLRAVVRNLCIDWHRKQFGRHRQFRSIARLSDFDREVYRLTYERAVSPEQSLVEVMGAFPGTTQKDIDESRARIEDSLTINQRWLLTNRTRRGKASESNGFKHGDDPLAQVVDDSPSPEAIAISQQERAQLSKALRRLPPRDRLLIRLRFEEGLTLSEVGRLLDIGNAQRTDRQIKEVLESLRKLLNEVSGKY